MEYIVSACFVGVNCTYDGTNNLIPKVVDLVTSGKALPVCPEQLGGLSTPRTPAEIHGGDGRDVINGKASVVTNDGVDVTENFLAGAREALKLARLVGAGKAIMKERSPSCGCDYIYRNGEVVKGNGVTTALFQQEGIEVRAL